MHKPEAPRPRCKETHPKFFLPSINQTRVVLPSQDRPLGKLTKDILLCDLFRKLFCSSCHYLSFHLQGDTLPSVWNREVSQKSDPTIPHVQQWWIQTVQNSPSQFGSIPCSQSLLFHYGGTAVLLFFFYRIMRRLPLHGVSHIDLCLRHFKEEPPTFRFFSVDHKSTPTFNMLSLWSPVKHSPSRTEWERKAEKLSTDLGFLLVFFLIMAFRAHQESWISMAIYTSPGPSQPSYLAHSPVFPELVFECAKVWGHKSNFRVHGRRKGGTVVSFPQHTKHQEVAQEVRFKSLWGF